jgi:hypothetical protein
MTKKVLSNLDFNSVAKLINLLDGTDPQDAATIAQLTAAIEGIKYKSSVSVAAQSNITLASPGATIDGYTPVSGNRDTGSVLLRNQTTVTENGIYIWNGAASAMTRSVDANLSAELTNAVVDVINGTDAGNSFRQTTVAPIIGTNDIVWVSWGSGVPAASETVAGKAEIATQMETDAGTDDARFITPLKLATWSGKPKRHAVNIGDGTATAYTVTHSLNTRDVTVGVYRVASPYDEILADIERSTLDTVTVTFAAAPTSNQFRVVALG